MRFKYIICIIYNYVNHNPEDPNDLKDWNCGDRTYHNDCDDAFYCSHRGTDYTLSPFWWNMMQNNSVEVLSVAEGVILNKEDGAVVGEYNIDGVEEITTFNKQGLNDNVLTFIIEDEELDFAFITINLDSGKLIDRHISDFEKPSIELNYNNHFFYLNSFGKSLSSYSFVKDDNEIVFDWEQNYNQSVSLIGQENNLLYLFDQADNSIFSIKASSGDIVEKKL